MAVMPSSAAEACARTPAPPSAGPAAGRRPPRAESATTPRGGARAGRGESARRRPTARRMDLAAACSAGVAAVRAAALVTEAVRAAISEEDTVGKADKSPVRTESSAKSVATL
jgi:hypothetical protein